jgi:hypothetical protein
MAVDARLRDEKSSDREQREIEWLGANQRVSCVIGKEAVLTRATDEIGARRQPWNGRR